MSELSATGAEAFANLWLYGAVLASIGVSTTWWWLRLDVRSRLSETTVRQIERRLGMLAFRVATVLILALLLRAWSHTFALFGWEGALSGNRLSTVAWRSLWGQAWKIQMAVSVVLMGAAVWARSGHRQGGWVAVAAASCGLCGVLPLMGHAAGSPVRVALHTTHVAGSGIWLGTLGVLLIVSRRIVGVDDRPIATDVVLSPFLVRFWRIAVTGVILLAAGGSVVAYMYLASLSDLWTTTYGRLLSAKIALFLAVGLCGWLNWRRFADAVTDTPGPFQGGGATRPYHLRFVMVEVGLAVAVMILTSVLTEMDHPFHG